MSLLDPHVNRSSLIGESYDLIAALAGLGGAGATAHVARMHPDPGGAVQQNGVVGAEETTPIQAALQERRFRSMGPATHPDPVQGGIRNRFSVFTSKSGSNEILFPIT